MLYNVFLSEGVQHPPPPSLSALQSGARQQLFSVPPSILAQGRTLYDAWPLYPPDQYVHTYPNSSIPFLTFNGDFDISTPWPNAAYSSLFYNKPNQHLRLLPTCPHVGFLASPTTDSPVPCGIQLMTSFFLSGGSSFNDSCIAKIVPLDWAATSTATKALSKSLFGTEDPWEFNQGPPNPSSSSSTSASASASSSTGGDGGDGLSGAAITGIVLGCVIGVLIVVLLLVTIIALLLLRRLRSQDVGTSYHLLSKDEKA